MSKPKVEAMVTERDSIVSMKMSARTQRVLSSRRTSLAPQEKDVRSSARAARKVSERLWVNSASCLLSCASSSATVTASDSSDPDSDPDSESVACDVQRYVRASPPQASGSQSAPKAEFTP